MPSLEAAWRAARAAEELDPDDDRLAAREQSAWDAYADACDAAGICLTPGCNAASPEHAHCPDHRE